MQLLSGDIVSGSPKILHVLAPTLEGGLERVVTMMCSGQKSSVHVAAVVEPGMAVDHPFIVQLRELGVPVTPIVVGARDYFSEFYLISALVAQLRPSVVHSHGYRSDVIGGLVARSHRVPTVSTVHGFTGGRLRNRLNERVQLLALRRADAVIVVSAPLARRLAEDGVRRDRIHLVPNAFTSLFDVLPRAVARERLGIRSDALVAGWVGRLSKEKGADVMLDALAESDPRWQLSVIGRGEEMERLREQSRKLRILPRVTWHGPIANAGSLFAAFDAFVLSSRTEGTPITLLEAMNAGVPIVATSVGGVPDVVDSAHALVVGAEQPAQIARALSQIDREPLAATERSRRAQNRLNQAFGSATWLAALDSVYEAAARTRLFLR